jgi:hypothetical protein
VIAITDGSFLKVSNGPHDYNPQAGCFASRILDEADYARLAGFLQDDP